MSTFKDDVKEAVSFALFVSLPLFFVVAALGAGLAIWRLFRLL